MNTALNIIHIDDNPVDRRLIKKRIERSSISSQFKLESFSEISSFLGRIKQSPTANIVLLDFDLNDSRITGLDLAKECRSRMPNAVIILISNFHEANLIQDSLTSGADDYYYKDSISDDFAVKILNTYHSSLYKRGVLNPSNPISEIRPYRDLPKFVGSTIENLHWSLSQQLNKNQTLSYILITGKQGTGKSIISKIIEAYQPKNIPFIRVNCNNIQENMFSLKFFGSIQLEAHSNSKNEINGFLSSADGGWLYLEEVTKLPILIQNDLLKAIENRQFKKLGSNHFQYCSIKLACSTEHNLSELVAKGLFLKDLFIKLQQLEILTPNLADRKDEIIDLIQYKCQNLEGGPYSIDQPAIELLIKNDWSSSNIDELFETIEQMQLQTLNKQMTALTLPRSFLSILNKNMAKNEFNQSAITDTITSSLPNTYLEPIIIRRISNHKMDYTDYCDLLLIELIRIINKEYSQEENFNLFFLEQKLNISRQTISSKIKKFYSKRLINKKELNQWITKRNTTKKTK